jgi:hypothetical protein
MQEAAVSSASILEIPRAGAEQRHGAREDGLR